MAAIVAFYWKTRASMPNVEDEDEPSDCKFCLTMAIIAVIMMLGAIPICYLLSIYGSSHYNFEVDSFESKLLTTNNKDQDMSLDVNVTLSLVNNQPMLFEKFLVLLAHDKDDYVLSSTELGTLYEDIHTEKKRKKIQIGMVVQNFTKEKHNDLNLKFTINIVGQYRTSIDSDNNEKYSLKVSCKGVQVMFLTSSSNFTFGSMLGGPLPCK